MANSLVALQAQAPNVAGAFNEGAQAAQGRQLNSLRIQGAQQELQNAPEDRRRKQAMELFGLIGSVGIGAMGGSLDGEVDPAKWSEGLDYLDRMIPDLGAAQYKDNPGLAPVAAQAAITAAQRIQLAKSDRDYELAAAEFQRKLDAAPSGPKPYSPAGKVQADVAAGILTPEQAAEASKPKPAKLSATELKAVYSAEDELPNLDASITQLERALELNDKAYSGYTAGLRGAIGAKLPDGAVPNFVADPKSAEATSEYEAIMTGEAATAMSAALKGATTDRELGIFIDIIGDVSKPPNVRKAAIERLLQLARAKKETAAKRIEELKGSGSPSPTGAQGGEQTVIDGVTYERDADGDWFEVN